MYMYNVYILVSECKALWGEHSSVYDLQHEDSSDEGSSREFSLVTEVYEK